MARTNRRRFIPVAYLFVIACLIGFATLLIQDARAGGGLIGTDAETGLARGVGYTFYVWLSVINLFSTSVFWAFMVDVFDIDQGKRMFPFIGIGGTLGALAGGRGASLISGLTESPYLPAGLMLIGAACFALAIATMLILDKRAGRSDLSPLEAVGPAASGGPSAESSRRGGSNARIGGGALEGVRAVATSPYLLGVGLWVVFMAVSNTLIYFTQANVILESTDTFSQRVGSFADFDSLAQVATLLTQVFVTTHLIRKLGVGVDARHPAARHGARFRRAGGVARVRRDADLPGRPPRDALRHLAPLPGNAVLGRGARGEVQGEADRRCLPV